MITVNEKFRQQLRAEKDTAYLEALRDLAAGYSQDWVAAAIREELAARLPGGAHEADESGVTILCESAGTSLAMVEGIVDGREMLAYRVKDAGGCTYFSGSQVSAERIYLDWVAIAEETEGLEI